MQAVFLYTTLFSVMGEKNIQDFSALEDLYLVKTMCFCVSERKDEDL
jgi:hypothetical protein